MIKKFIMGVPGRGDEVLKELEKLGGVVVKTLDYNDKEALFFIQKDNSIDYYSKAGKMYDIIIECFEEIVLPPIFVPETFTLTFETAPKTNGCEGCFFNYSMSCHIRFNLPECGKKIIYKLKTQ